MQKQISTLVGVIIIVAVAVVLFGGVFAYQYFSKSQTPITNDQQNSNTQTITDETAGWKTYTNDDWGIEFKYPEVLGEPVLKEFNQISNESSLCFKKENTRAMCFLSKSTIEDVKDSLQEREDCEADNDGLCEATTYSLEEWQKIKNLLISDVTGNVECILNSRCEYCEVLNSGIKMYIEHQCFSPGGNYDGQYFYGNNTIFSLSYGEVGGLERRFNINQEDILSTFKFTK